MGTKPGKDLTSGSIPGHLESFALPMLVGNLLQTGYGFINAIWIGNLVGENAVGVAAVSFPISFVFLSVCIGPLIPADGEKPSFTVKKQKYLTGNPLEINACIPM